MFSLFDSHDVTNTFQHLFLPLQKKIKQKYLFNFVKMCSIKMAADILEAHLVSTGSGGKAVLEIFSLYKAILNGAFREIQYA